MSELEPAPWADGREVVVQRWGRVPYEAAVARLERLADARAAGAAPDTLLLLEHPHVVTVSRRTPPEHLLLDEVELARRGVEVRPTRRGGDVTYHGPGQLVCWPVVSLKPDRCDVRRYMRDLEEVMLGALGRFGIAGGRVEGLTGAWVRAGEPDARKIGALGVHINRWVTAHGLALNVNTDLEYFRLIVPCGIRDRGVTSLAEELGRPVPMAAAEAALLASFARVFGARLIDTDSKS